MRDSCDRRDRRSNSLSSCSPPEGVESPRVRPRAGLKKWIDDESDPPLEPASRWLPHLERVVGDAQLTYLAVRNGTGWVVTRRVASAGVVVLGRADSDAACGQGPRTSRPGVARSLVSTPIPPRRSVRGGRPLDVPPGNSPLANVGSITGNGIRDSVGRVVILVPRPDWPRRCDCRRSRAGAHCSRHRRYPRQDRIAGLGRSRRLLNEVHQSRAVRPIYAAVVALHDPIVLLIRAGGDLRAEPDVDVSPFSVLAHNSSGQEKSSNERQRPENPPDEFDDDRDDHQQRKQRAEPARIARPT